MIILMGSVGSGKTEQGERLVKRLGVPRLSTSQILREHPSKRRQAQMAAGELISDKELIKLVEPELEKVQKQSKEFILDGAPRSIVQAQWLNTLASSGQIHLTAVIHIDVSDKEVLKRLLARGRNDDKKKIISNRLKQYHSVTTPVLDYLKAQGIAVHHVNGQKSPLAVEKSIRKILGLK